MSARRANQDDGRGTLEYGGQHDQPAARSPVTQNAGAADPEIRPATGDRPRDIYIRATFSNGNVQARIAVEALLKRLIVAGELKLMLPFELQSSGIQREGRM